MQTPYPTDPTPILLGDGKERYLRVTLGSLKRIKMAGVSLIGGAGPALTIDQVPALLAESLLDHDLTAEQIEEMVDVRALPYITAQLTAALAVSAPAQDDGDRPTQAPTAAPVQ